MAEHVISSITYRDDTYLLKNAVLMKKTFENVIATANDIDNATFYFGKIVADSWDVPLRIRYRVKAYCPDNKNYNQYADVSYFIIRNTAAYCVENVVYSTSYRAAYYHNLYRATQAGSTGYGHLLGESLYASTNPLDTKLKRTFEFEILEMENCTFEFFESPVLYKNAPGTGSTNYTGRSDYYFHVSGLYPDNNTVTQTLIASRLMADTNGVKQYSIMYETKDGKVESLTSGSGTGTTKTWNTNAKIPYPPRLYYYSGSSNVANGSYIATSATYINISTIDMRYSDNITTTVGYTMNKPLYLECDVDADGYLTIGESPYKQTFTEGKYYIFVGWVHTAVYTLSFFNAHDVYYYDGTNLIPYERQAYAKKDHTHNYIPNTKEGLYTAINLLDVSEVTPGSDQMYVVTAQASNQGDEYFRRPIGSLWDYFKDCISLRKENSGSVVKDIVYNSTEAKFTVTMTDMVGEVDATVGATYHGEIFNVYSGSNINKATGQYSHAEGINTSATAYATHAEGSFTTVNGSSSHGEGYGTKTTNDYAHAEGYATEANGFVSHAEGYYAKANGYYSHVEGSYTEATGNYSHAEGSNTKAEGQYSHAEGDSSIVTRDFSHAEGNHTKAMAEASHTEGRNTIAIGYYQGMHAEGYGSSQLPSSITISSSTDDILTAWKIDKGYDSSKFTLASGNGAHVEGYSTLAFNDGAHAEGYMTFAQNTGAHAEGEYTRAVNTTAHAEGYGTTASGNCSHAEGYSNIIAPKALWSETTPNILTNWETAIKRGTSYAYTMARGDYSHTEGSDTLGLGIGSHAEGVYTVANGNYSHSEGYWTYAMSNYQHVGGKYNVKDADDKYAFIIGNGTSDDARSNLFAIGWDGKLYINNATEGVDISKVEDTKVTQTNSTGNADYRILFSENANDTTSTEGARKNTNLKYNPSSKILYVPSMYGNNAKLNATLYNITHAIFRNTSKEIVIQTGVKWVSSAHMPVVHLYGYAYGLQSPIELKIGFYIYSNNIGWCGVANMGAWKPDIYLFKYTPAGDTQAYVAIGLVGSIYFPQYAIDVQEEMGGLANVNKDPAVWKNNFYTESGEGMIPTPDNGVTCIKVPYKQILTPAGNLKFKAGTTDVLTYDGSNSSDQTITIASGDTNGQVKVNTTNVTVYTHPTYTAASSGFYKVTVDGTGHVSGTTAVVKADITALGIPGSDTTYSAGTGLSLSGTTFNHSNSITAVTTAAFKKFKYDAQGHITGTADVAAADLPEHTHNYVPNTKSGVNAALNLLDDGSDVPSVDNMYVITGHASMVNNTFYKRQISSLWGYFKTKISLTDSGTGSFVKNVTQSNGAFTVTKGNITAADLPAHDHNRILAYPEVNSDRRPSNANFATSTNGTGAIFGFIAGGNTSNKPPALSSTIDGNSHIFQMNWDTTAGYDSQFAIYNKNPGISFRTQNAGTWGHWVTITANNPSEDKVYNLDDFSKTDTTYSAGTGLSLSGTTFNHSNSITAVTTAVFKKFTYDSEGHITGSSAVTSSDLPAHDHSRIAGVASTTSVPGNVATAGHVLFHYNVNTGLTDNMPTSNNANAIISISKHNGNYTSQLGFSSNGNLYYRSANGETIVGKTWKEIAFVGHSHDNATTSKAGFMSATDKTKLDGITEGATKVESSTTNGSIKINGTETTVYTHPSYTAKTSGLYKVTVDATGHVSAATAVAKSDITALGIPGSDTNTTYTIAKGDALGQIKVTPSEGDAYNVTVKGNEAVAYGTCATAAATAAKVVTISNNDNWELNTGSIIVVKFSASNSASNVTLNVNGSGAKQIWYNNALYTSSGTAVCGYANRYIYYMYDGTNWVWLGHGIDINDNNYDRVRFQQNILAKSAITSSNIIVANDNTGFFHLKTGNQFDITYPILFAGSSITAAANGNNNYLVIALTITTTQALTLTVGKPVFIKGTLSGTKFTPVSTAPLTQTIPTSDDGYEYILLGFSYSSTAMYLLPDHPIYAYRGGSFAEVSGNSITDLSIDGQKITYTRGDGTTGTLTTQDTDTTYSAGTGLSLSGTTFNHSNSVTAVTTAGFYKVKYDAQGHITGTTAVAKSDITGLGIPGSDTNTTYTLSGAYGTSSDTWVTTLTPSTGTATTSTVPKGTTSAYGLMKLIDSTSSTSTALAATANAVKSAYDLANGKSTVSISRSLTSGTKIATITINGTATDLYCQTDTNTDTKVRQSLSTVNEKHPILMGYSQTSDTTANVDNVSYRNNSVYVNPSTGTVGATEYSVNSKVTMKYDTSIDAVKFVFT